MSARYSSAALIILAAIFLAGVVWPAAQKSTHGFASYYTASRLLVEEGLDARIYDDSWFRVQTEAATNGAASDIFNANPPTMALLALRVAGLPHETARAVATGLNAIGLCGALVLIGYTLRLRSGVLLSGVALGLLGAPTIAQFQLGQAYVVVLLLYIIVWLGLRSGSHWLVGMGLAFAMVLKLAGAPLWLFVLVLGRWRALAWAVGISLAIFALSMPFISLDSWRTFLFEALPRAVQSPTVASTAYQSLPGFWAQLLRGDPVFNPAPIVDWPFGAALFTTLDVLAIVGVTLFFARRLPIDIGFAAATVASVAIVPFAEQHQYIVMILPAMIVLARLQLVILPSSRRQVLARTPVRDKGAWASEARNLFSDADIEDSSGTLFPLNDMTSVWLLLIAAAFLMVPLPYQSPQLANGWLALLAYPRLYGALSLWGLLVFQNEIRISRTIAHPDTPQAIHQKSGY